MEELIETVEKLASATSFRGDSLITMKNLYTRYINKNHNICMSCPGSINHMITVFRTQKDSMIKKITLENVKILEEKKEEEDGKE